MFHLPTLNRRERRGSTIYVGGAAATQHPRLFQRDDDSGGEPMKVAIKDLKGARNVAEAPSKK